MAFKEPLTRNLVAELVSTQAEKIEICDVSKFKVNLFFMIFIKFQLPISLYFRRLIPPLLKQNPLWTSAWLSSLQVPPYFLFPSETVLCDIVSISETGGWWRWSAGLMLSKSSERWTRIFVSREDRNYSDATLASDDDKMIKDHKMTFFNILFLFPSSRLLRIHEHGDG